MELPPTRPLYAAAGVFFWSVSKSIEFPDWRELVVDGVVKVGETNALKLSGWSYHLYVTMARFKELWVARDCLHQEPASLRGWRFVYVYFRYGRILPLQCLVEGLEFADRLFSVAVWVSVSEAKPTLLATQDQGMRLSHQGRTMTLGVTHLSIIP